MNRRCALAAIGTLCAWDVAVAQAQAPTLYGIGRPATPADSEAHGISVAPDGTGLPRGRGTVAEGRVLYAAQCAGCHGDRGQGVGDFAVLAGGQGTLATSKPLQTVGSYWPYATTVWSYIHRAMPYPHPGTLTVDETYAVTAYVLHLNGIVRAKAALDEKTLPRLRMPNRDGFVDDPRPDMPPPNADTVRSGPRTGPMSR
jgi:S-disulfanyl-L-cysteine oxidoreductase SoxD